MQCKSIIINLLLIFFIGILVAEIKCNLLKNQVAEIKISDLRTEYRINPLGIDAVNPRLSWILESDIRGQKQSAYQILVSSSEEKLKNHTGDLWNSGRIDSEHSIHIKYEGKRLDSYSKCYWKVRVWDMDGIPSAWSAPANWTMGILSDTDWNAKWISMGKLPMSGQDSSLPLFRHRFRIEKDIKRATAFVCGLGFYEFRLNGNKVGDLVIDPGWTNYRKSCLYTTYDVSDHIKHGDNAIGVMLGNGMYNVTGGRYIKFTGTFGPPKLIFQLCIEYEDGTSDIILSDDSWRVSSGPISFSCIFGGEDYDARLEQDGWDRPGFDDSTWQTAQITEGPGGQLNSQIAPPIKVMDVFKPIKISEPAPGTYVYDLGQNFSGWPQITVSGKTGSVIKIIPGELLDENGLVTQKGSGGPSYYTYTLKGGMTEVWHPRFTYYGFRYVQVEGGTRNQSETNKVKPLIRDVQGHFVHSSAEVIGSFSCSNDLFNKIHHIINAAIKSNMQSVLTDCPHREKLGWLEQAYLMGPSVMYNYDIPLLLTKISIDMRESQLENGLVPDIAPEYVVFKGGFRDSPEWGSASVVVPWYIYKRYGDLKVLEDNYTLMKKYVDYLTGVSKNHILSYGLGDWCDFGPKPYGPSQHTPIPLTATAIYYHDIDILRNAAKILGKLEDTDRYSKLAVQVYKAFNDEFYNNTTQQYATNSQTSNAMPLVIGLVEQNLESRVLLNVVEDVRKHDNHLTSGDIGHRFLVQALNKWGRSDVMFDMTNQTDVPSYGSQIAQGATALTEVWDPARGFSHNHFMMGHAEEWFYNGLGGIQPDPESEGFKKIIIKPQVVGDLTWVKCRHKSMYGEIISNWRFKNNILHMDETIPVNTTAKIYVPGGNIVNIKEGVKPATEAEGITFIEMQEETAVFEVGSGNYQFISSRTSK